MSELYHISSLRRTNHLFGSSPILLWAAEPLRPPARFCNHTGTVPFIRSSRIESINRERAKETNGSDLEVACSTSFLVASRSDATPCQDSRSREAQKHDNIDYAATFGTS